MTKRRRERDKPKAGPEALYNPNKRVLLSYGSDEEVVDRDTPAAVEGSLLNRAVANYADDTSADKEPLAQGTAAPTDAGHEEPPVDEPQVEHEWDEAVEEPKSNDIGLWDRTVSKNIHTGQWAALGSLSYQYEDDEEGEEFQSEDEEAMAYLRAVRSERQTMPDFLAAPRTYSHEDMYDNGIGDTRGYYEDGAYIAAPTTGPTIPESAKTTVDPQEAFATAVKARFLKQRDNMHIKPSAEARAKLDERHPTSLPKGNNKACAAWLRILKTTSPQSDHLRTMEQAGVVRVLELIQNRMLPRERAIAPTVSAWIWALLARLDDVGTMDSDRIASLREFAKRVIIVQLSFRDPEAAAELEKISAIENGAQPAIYRAKRIENEDHSATEDKGTSTSNVAASETSVPDDPDGTNRYEAFQRMNTLATLDTILVLVGDVFGQRDLLDFRQPWTEQGDSHENDDTIVVADAADVEKITISASS